jgi:hypothetical protein
MVTEEIFNVTTVLFPDFICKPRFKQTKTQNNQKLQKNHVKSALSPTSKAAHNTLRNSEAVLPSFIQN